MWCPLDRLGIAGCENLVISGFSPPYGGRPAVLNEIPPFGIYITIGRSPARRGRFSPRRGLRRFSRPRGPARLPPPRPRPPPSASRPPPLEESTGGVEGGGSARARLPPSVTIGAWREFGARAPSVTIGARREFGARAPSVTIGARREFGARAPSVRHAPIVTLGARRGGINSAPGNDSAVSTSVAVARSGPRDGRRSPGCCTAR